MPGSAKLSEDTESRCPSRRLVVDTMASGNGQDLKEMFGAATRWLERSAQTINSLNVFPVPDGDTGTNMLLTMRAAAEEADHCEGSSAAAVAQAMAKGSLMGARGNSGVILSQIFRGLAKGLDGKVSFTGSDLATALVESSSFAYRGVTKPVEGTILTVIREAAAAAQAKSARNGADVLAIMEATVDEARASVARTPTLLPILRQAGVVDAGGQGLCVVLEGALRYLRGDDSDVDVDEPTLVTIPTDTALKLAEQVQYGYCTEFLLQDSRLGLEAVRDKLTSLGDSVLVVGDDSAIRVHLHTFDPGAALSYATSLGTLRRVKVENMQDQHEDFVASQPLLLATSISTVAVASGEGISQAFRSIGATIVVPGGQTMNPSVEEVLQAVESVPSDMVVLLPNNPNVLLSANQVRDLTEKKVEVVPSETIPQGIAGLLALNYELDFETNIAAMREALSAVLSGEVTTAVRSMNTDGLPVTEGQAIAFLDGKLVAAADSMIEVVNCLLAVMNAEECDLITIYYGADTESVEAERIVRSIQARYPALEIELVAGDQPHYNYIISAE
jgi:DAK2 domain fusion protein YloV